MCTPIKTSAFLNFTRSYILSLKKQKKKTARCSIFFQSSCPPLVFRKKLGDGSFKKVKYCKHALTPLPTFVCLLASLSVHGESAAGRARPGPCEMREDQMSDTSLSLWSAGVNTAMIRGTELSRTHKHTHINMYTRRQTNTHMHRHADWNAALAWVGMAQLPWHKHFQLL